MPRLIPFREGINFFPTFEKTAELILAFLWTRKPRWCQQLMKNMNRLFVITLLAVLSLESTEGVFADQDWEYWSKYSFEIAGGKKIGFSLQPEFKFKNTFEEYYYSKTYFGLFYKLNEFIKIKGYYAYKTKKAKTGWRRTDLLYLDPSLKFNLQNIDLSNRFRFEYDFDKRELVYRNRLKVEKSFYKSITFFIKEEPFYSFLSGRFKENRFSVGSSVKILNRARFSGEYMLNSKKVNLSWRSANVLATSLSFLF
ncbi:MAG: DUF2490 domain-containing protein [candidate division Zixibacteria bacterium]|nr:DUF2490 domain-containing protein [candidate division Zixibacteria bacterium]